MAWTTLEKIIHGGIFQSKYFKCYIIDLDDRLPQALYKAVNQKRSTSMSYVLSLEERLEIAEQMGAKLSAEDWEDDNGQSELSSFLDDLDVPRHNTDE